jgi:hypothetical protein
MNAIQKAIEVLQGCLEHPGADDAISGLRAMMMQPAHIDQQRHNDYMAGFNEGYDRAERFAKANTAHTAQREPLTDAQRKAIEKANTTQGMNGDYYDAFGIIDDVEAAHGITKGCA